MEGQGGLGNPCAAEQPGIFSSPCLTCRKPKYDSALIAMQHEAAEQAEENWESLKAAEKSIFEDIAKGLGPQVAAKSCHQV